MPHARVRKRRLRRRRKGIMWDFNGDGRFPTERIKGWWKRYWRKWNQRRLHGQDRLEFMPRQDM